MVSGKQTAGKKKKERHNFDYVLLTVVLFLVGFGLLMIYSTSSYEAGIDYGDSAYFLKKQAGSTMIGFVAMFFVSRIPYKIWKKCDAVAILGSIILILAVLTPLGIKRNGALRWLNLGFITMQPAEVAKIGVIIYEASIITKLGKSLRTPKGLAVILVPPAVLALMLWKITNNMSSAIIVFGIAIAMLFVAVPDYKHFVALGAAGIAGVVAIVFYAVSADATGEFRLKRIKAWLDPESHSTDKAFQTLQALYAIGSGGIWGKGLGQSMQKRGFLPESQNDMIFSIICEELGLFGAIAVIFLFIVLIWCCMVIANNTVDLFGALLVVGVMAHYAIQVILNIAVVTNTIPNTGISLPFISYGGTSVLFLLAEIGIVLNVSKTVRNA
ncbi:MAG: cell division protein FtsW [Lachnospiraceae bacterium]|nr:cell division protein FtsW [Lachnospiraceae bacterium]